MRINCEEVFGPVVSTVRVKDYEEALEIANRGEFGLSAGIVTNSLKHSRHFRRNIRAGMVMINLPTAGVDYHVPSAARANPPTARASRASPRSNIIPRSKPFTLGAEDVERTPSKRAARRLSEPQGQARADHRRRLRHRRRPGPRILPAGRGRDAISTSRPGGGQAGLFPPGRSHRHRQRPRPRSPG